ncbi:hypothetical protein [Streptomyces doebereineriae]|uniref:Excalibur calcium-binding domain-containing protein n=1 Tax=Streptomyces doebereineriae TaxID=3075528 RepID=A0ABU2VE76_9ACTN|nr:hypothetical protein [Streptomyces sp. DSM 41640]MDT0483658.1 hypothetical protein [Streptomyces sp. DSM 41640]
MHHGTDLDRDGDGIGCDQPPADCVAHDEAATAEDTGKDNRATSPRPEPTVPPLRARAGSSNRP